MRRFKDSMIVAVPDDVEDAEEFLNAVEFSAIHPEKGDLYQNLTDDGYEPR